MGDFQLGSSSTAAATLAEALIAEAAADNLYELSTAHLILLLDYYAGAGDDADKVAEITNILLNRGYTP